MFGIGPMELVLILVVALLVFGPKRLPELARTLGRGLGEFRRASNDLRQSLALDDLQKDLRDGLSGDQSGENSIHRPAQAGDSLPDPTASEESPEAEYTGDVDAEIDTPHPGELPLGDDHTHNSVSSEVAIEPESADLAAQATEKAADGTPDKAGAELPPSPTQGDSELGNVPVSSPSRLQHQTKASPKSDSERG